MLRTRSRSALRITVAIAALAAAVLVPAVAASASQVSYNGSVLTYNAASGESNGPIVTTNPYPILCGSVPAPCLSIFDPYATISVPAGKCTGGGSSDVLCEMPSSIVANLGDRDDSYYGWTGDETIDAGPGNDNPIEAGGGDDHVNGGPGSDNLVGGPGDDWVDGGAGDDYLEGIAYTEDSNTLGSDTYVGGGGSDRLTYDSRSDDLNLSLDGGANDGAPGENDNIGADVVTVIAGSGSDTFTGNAYSNGFGGGEGDDTANGAGGDDNLVGGPGNDRLNGGDGQDILGGESGNDTLEGGSGVDRFWGDSIGACIPGYCDTGQDEIYARDGSQETINCGPGTDSAQVDNIDFVVQEAGGTDQCESVDGAGPGPGGGAGGGRAAIAVTYRAPRAGVIRARGIAVISNRLTQVARTTRRVRRAGRVKLQLKMSAAANRALASQGSLKVLVRVTFKPKHGRAKTVSRTVTLQPVS
jgi:hypothetical protein